MINSNISVNGLITVDHVIAIPGVFTRANHRVWESNHKSVKLSMIIRLSVVLRRTVFDDID